MNLRPPHFALAAERLERLDVCLRPFRAEGPRLEVEEILGKRVVHNYGHGGAGWSLSWGCAEEAAALAFPEPARARAAPVAVLGAGAIGLTSAVALARIGARVTIYAERMGAETRSARATGRWSPASRVAFADAVDAAFHARWRAWSQASMIALRAMIGAVVEAPVVRLEDAGSKPLCRRAFFTDAEERETDGAMIFDIGACIGALETEFRRLGGVFVRRLFADPSECLRLDEPVLVNCTGYGARALWRDDGLTPVRGQIARYRRGEEPSLAVIGAEAHVVSRPDALILQYTGPNDDWGFGVDHEREDASEIARAKAALADAALRLRFAAPL